MRINRLRLLQQLECVEPGLSTREVTEQSSCVVFQEGRVFTFNDEVSCSAECDLDAHGAVHAAPLLSILRKLVEDEIDVEVGEDEMKIIGKRRSIGLRMESQILLPIGAVKPPKRFTDLHPEFCEAVNIVQQCASKNEAFFNVTCVHVHPNWVEACDNYQLSRYDLETGVKQPFLVRRDAIKHIQQLGMTQFGETESWVHFRNTNGLVMSCRRYVEQYPDLSKLLKVKGSKMTLPKGLTEAVERASIFSAENTEQDEVMVDLSPGRVRVRGTGISGWYKETRKINYDGAPLSFMIPPQLFITIVKRFNDCEVTKDKLKVDGGKFIYVTTLGEVSASNDRKKTAVEVE